VRQRRAALALDDFWRHAMSIAIRWNAAMNTMQPQQ
jgi:hypothetical protein